MYNVPLAIAKKLLALKSGETLAGSRLDKGWLNMLRHEEIISIQQMGRTKTRIVLVSAMTLDNFLRNQFGVNDLEAYVKLLEEKEATRMQASLVASDTKLSQARSFKGFLINVIEPIKAELNGGEILLNPRDGAFIFIYDYENFKVPSQVQIIGMENPESFRHPIRHQHLFPQGKKLFVSRYPQNLDLVRWLKTIPNPYLHFGDLDLAGIAIFEYEFRKHLGERASLIIPNEVENLIEKHGSRKLYNRQYQRYGSLNSDDEEVQSLIDMIHRFKKGVEQEGMV